MAPSSHKASTAPNQHDSHVYILSFPVNFVVLLLNSYAQSVATSCQFVLCAGADFLHTGVPEEVIL